MKKDNKTIEDTEHENMLLRYDVTYFHFNMLLMFLGP